MATMKEKKTRKIEANGIPSCLILSLLIVFTWQLEILVTTQNQFSKIFSVIIFTLYYILGQAVNALSIHKIFRVCFHGGGGPR